MSTTQPIRDKEELKNFMEYYRKTAPNPRNYAMVVLGLHTALRISDVLRLTWNMVYDFENQEFRRHLCLFEKKTGKKNTVALNMHVVEALQGLAQKRRPQPADYLFTRSTSVKTPLSRSQAFRIVKRAAAASVHSGNISCHSLRKTFGYYAWKQGTPPALLMDIYNHSSYAVTKKYLGINQDERDSIFMEMNFMGMNFIE
ncbi:MAG: tyrosine-type recombinase/integrase [Lachnospiraceae bacterium]|nr:tyrosine-type recombinase/integrase [Lachnospiraceae bacterium]